MKENYIIATRPHNALLVFRYECIPDKNENIPEDWNEQRNSFGFPER